MTDLSEENWRLREAAQALVQRWDTPGWKDAPATGAYINALRAALDRQCAALDRQSSPSRGDEDSHTLTAPINPEDDGA